MKPRWLGGPIEAMGLDEIVDVMVAIFSQQLCYQLHEWHKFPAGWPSSAEERVAIRSRDAATQGKFAQRRVTFGRACCQMAELADFLLTPKFQTSIIATLHQPLPGLKVCPLCGFRSF